MDCNYSVHILAIRLNLENFGKLRKMKSMKERKERLEENEKQV